MPDYAPIPPPQHPTYDLDAVRLSKPGTCLHNVMLALQICGALHGAASLCRLSERPWTRIRLV